MGKRFDKGVQYGTKAFQLIGAGLEAYALYKGFKKQNKS